MLLTFGRLDSMLLSVQHLFIIRNLGSGSFLLNDLIDMLVSTSLSTWKIGHLHQSVLWMCWYPQTSAVMSSCSLASSSSAPVVVQTPVNVHLQTYDWNVSDQKCELRLYLGYDWKMKDSEHLDYILVILRKDGYAAVDHLVPVDADRQDPRYSAITLGA